MQLTGRQTAFTLIELLVVIVLLGVISSFVVLSINSTSLERKMEETAKRFHALILLAHEEAIIQAREMALQLDKQEYQFLQQRKGKWVRVADQAFKPGKIDPGLTVRIESTQAIKNFSEEKNNGSIYILSSGELSPFEMIIKMKAKSYPYYRLSGQFNGMLKLEKITASSSEVS